MDTKEVCDFITKRCDNLKLNHGFLVNSEGKSSYWIEGSYNKEDKTSDLLKSFGIQSTISTIREAAYHIDFITERLDYGKHLLINVLTDLLKIENHEEREKEIENILDILKSKNQ